MDKFERKTSLPKNLESSLDIGLENELKNIVDLIKSNGFENNVQIINDWRDKAEKWVKEDPKLHRRRAIIVNFAEIDFRVAIDDINEALNCWDDVIYMIIQEGFLDLKELYKDKESELLKLL